MLPTAKSLTTIATQGWPRKVTQCLCGNEHRINPKPAFLPFLFNDLSTCAGPRAA